MARTANTTSDRQKTVAVSVLVGAPSMTNKSAADLAAQIVVDGATFPLKISVRNLTANELVFPIVNAILTPHSTSSVAFANAGAVMSLLVDAQQLCELQRWETALEFSVDSTRAQDEFSQGAAGKPVDSSVANS